MIHNQVWIRFFCCTFYRITPLLIKWSTRFFLIRTRVLEELRHVEFSNQLTRYSSDAIQWSIDTICVVLFVRKIARGSCTEPTLQDEPYKAEEDARSPFFWTLCLYLLLCSALKTPVGAMTSAILVEHDRLRLLLLVCLSNVVFSCFFSQLRIACIFDNRDVFFCLQLVERTETIGYAQCMRSQTPPMIFFRKS